MVAHMSTPAPPSIVIVGGGGHGRELYWALSAAIDAGQCDGQVAGFVDDRPPEAGLLDRIGSVWLGPIQTLAEIDANFVLGIGSPQARSAVAALVAGFGRDPVAVMHPSVLIGPDVDWGEGFVACANVSVTTNVRFGAHVHLNRHVTVGHDCVVGDFVSLHPAAMLSGNVTVGARTMVGAGAVVLPGVTIGSDVQVGAGAVVTKDIRDSTTVVGVPAKRMR